MGRIRGVRVRDSRLYGVRNSQDTTRVCFGVGVIHFRVLFHHHGKGLSVQQARGLKSGDCSNRGACDLTTLHLCRTLSDGKQYHLEFVTT